MEVELNYSKNQSLKEKETKERRFQERKENQNGLKIASTVHMASTVKRSKI